MHINLFQASTQPQSQPTQHQHSQNAYPPSRQILPSQKFKCYMCFMKEDRNSICEFCQDTGQLSGDHPMINLVQRILELEMQPKQENTDDRPEVSVHRNFVCDQCQMDPIQGIRYSCKQCNDYDLCEGCYLRQKHKHKKFEKIGKNGLIRPESPTKKRLSQAVQKQKLLGLGRSLIYKITQMR